jgi:hypothetical protein
MGDTTQTTVVRVTPGAPPQFLWDVTTPYAGATNVAGGGHVAIAGNSGAWVGPAVPGAPSRVASFEGPIALDGARLFGTNTSPLFELAAAGDEIAAAPVDGSAAPAPIATGEGGVVGTVIVGDTLYALESASGRIVAIPASGGAPRVLASGITRASQLVSDGTTLYWIAGGRIASMPIAGGPVNVLEPSTAAQSLAVDDATLVWIDAQNSIYAEAKAGGPKRQLGKVAGGYPPHPAAVGHRLYFVSLDFAQDAAVPDSVLFSIPLWNDGASPPSGPSPGDCTGTHLDCNQNTNDGCEVDVAIDSANCGACGHDCRGGACNAGACGLVLPLGSAPPPAGRVVSDGDTMYWVTSSGSVLSRPFAGGPWKVVGSMSPGAQAVALDGGWLYAADSTQLLSLQIASGQPATVGPLGDFGAAGAAPLVVSRGAGFWAANGAIETTGGTLASPLATGLNPSPSSLAVDAANVYFTVTNGTTATDSGVYVLPLAPGSAAKPLATGAGFAGSTDLASDDTNLYWTSFVPSGGQEEIWTMPKTGGTPKSIASGPFAPESLTSADGRLFFTDNEGIHSVDLAGTTPATFTAVPLERSPIAVGKLGVVARESYYGEVVLVAR